MTIQVTQSGIIHCHAAIRLPLSTTTAWGQLRDFHRFAVQNLFHASIQIDGYIPRQGASLLIEHRFVGFKTVRRGRILRWRENEGFAFSDLSLRNANCGFPHVISFRLEPCSATDCVLHIRVNGRWTMATPQWLSRIWLRWVFSQMVRSTDNQLLMFAAFRQTQRTIAHDLR